MCGTCGCGEPAASQRAAVHAHGHDHAHEGEARRVAVEESLLAENERHARALATRLRRLGIDAIGLRRRTGSREDHAAGSHAGPAGASPAPTPWWRATAPAISTPGASKPPARV